MPEQMSWIFGSAKLRCQSVLQEGSLSTLAAQSLETLAVKSFPNLQGQPVTSVEWWAHSRPSGSGSGHQLHYDLDEVDLKKLEVPSVGYEGPLSGQNLGAWIWLGAVFLTFGAWSCNRNMMKTAQCVGASYSEASIGVMRALPQRLLGPNFC